MRINILQAGLVTYLMAGKGFLPKDEEEPKRGADTESWNSFILPPRPKAAPKGEPH